MNECVCINMGNLADSSLLNSQDERGFTPLMWAAAFGEIMMVEFLLQKVRNTHFIATQSGLYIYIYAFYLNNIREQIREHSLENEKVPCLWPVQEDLPILLIFSYNMALILIPMTGYEQFNYSENVHKTSSYTTTKYCRNIFQMYKLSLSNRMVGPLFCMQFVGITQNVLKLS